MPEHRVLIIDDESDIREVAAMSLETVSGWEVFQAASGIEGLEIARAQKPEAILLDVMMPDMDGPTTLQAIRSDKTISFIPIIFLTAKVQNNDQKTLGEMGITAVLSKPFDPLTLGDQISKALGW